MTDPIRRVGGPEPVDRREGERRERERRAPSTSHALLPRPAAGPEFTPEPGPARAAVHSAPESGAAAFAAQQMGQTGQKRGLRGGAPVLDAARAAYLGTEYSGAAERRPLAGKAAKTDI